MISDYLHAELSGQLSVSVSDPAHCPTMEQILVRERVPVVPHGSEQVLQALQALHSPSYHSKIQVYTETFDLTSHEHPSISAWTVGVRRSVLNILSYLPE